MGLITASFFDTEERAQRVVYEVAGFRAGTQHLAVKTCPQPSVLQGQRLPKPSYQMEGEERHASLLSAAWGWGG